MASRLPIPRIPPIVGIIAAVVIPLGAYAYVSSSGSTPAPTAEPDAPVQVAVPSGTPSSSPGESAAPDEDPEATSEAEPERVTADEQAAGEAAANAIIVYTEHSWQDSGPGDLLDRLRAIATPFYKKTIAENFPVDQESQAYWRDVIVANQESYTTEIESVEKSGFYSQTAKKMTFTVYYKTYYTSKDQPEPGEAETTSQFVTVALQDGEWLVEDIESTSSRTEGVGA